ncbi:MAG: acetylornithine transaminase [Polyangiaceae bacterium]
MAAHEPASSTGLDAVHADERGDLDQDALVALGKQRILGNYKQAPVVFVSGSGSRLTDKAGTTYLDFTGGVAVNVLGHAHPRLAQAIADQARRVMHVSNYFYNEENVLLADELCALTGFDKAFFCNSGAEANEALFKLARRHFSANGKPEKFRFIAFEKSFHGRTMATVTLTGQKAYSEGFGPRIEGITHVPYGDLDAVAKAMGPDVCGIFVEPVQGEGGVLPAPPGFLAGLRKLCDEHGALLLIDEIQTGIGRTGAFLGSTVDGVRADAISLAKGLAGGFPIGVTLVSEALANALPPGTHGSTFGGNPLACAAARAVLAAVRDEHLVEAAAQKGALLGDFLAALANKYASICDGERGRGLLRGILLKPHVDARSALQTCREKGVLLTIAGAQVLRFTPALTVSVDEIEECARKVGEALAIVEARTGPPKKE